eukprot:1654980-Rhodomonas_salina.2
MGAAVGSIAFFRARDHLGSGEGGLKAVALDAVRRIQCLFRPPVQTPEQPAVQICVVCQYRAPRRVAVRQYETVRKQLYGSTGQCVGQSYGSTRHRVGQQGEGRVVPSRHRGSSYDHWYRQQQ